MKHISRTSYTRGRGVILNFIMHNSTQHRIKQCLLCADRLTSDGTRCLLVDLCNHFCQHTRFWYLCSNASYKHAAGLEVRFGLKFSLHPYFAKDLTSLCVCAGLQLADAIHYHAAFSYLYALYFQILNNQFPLFTDYALNCNKTHLPVYHLSTRINVYHCVATQFRIANYIIIHYRKDKRRLKGFNSKIKH